MTSCNGPIGYAIHVAKTDTHTRSYNTNEEADDDTVRFVIHKNYRQMLMKAEINDVEDTVLFDSGSSIAAVLFYIATRKLPSADIASWVSRESVSGVIPSTLQKTRFMRWAVPK